MKTDKTGKIRNWRELNDNQKDKVSSAASEYGYSADFEKVESIFGEKIGGHGWKPSINYGAKAKEAAPAKEGAPDKKAAEQRLKKNLMDNNYTEEEANEYIERAKKQGKL